jgi:hypothetical protein
MSKHLPVEVPGRLHYRHATECMRCGPTPPHKLTMKAWKTAREIEALIVYQMQKSGVCAEAASVAVEACGTGWIARLVPPSASDKCEREFETIY